MQILIDCMERISKNLNRIAAPVCRRKPKGFTHGKTGGKIPRLMTAHSICQKI